MMPRTGLIGVATLSLAIASPGVAQEKPGTIAEVVVTRAKAGAVKAYEDGRKRHMAWHKRQNDPWSWHTWQAASGPYTGSYVTISFGHAWKDFDTWEGRFGQGDTADVDLNLTPHTESATVAYYELLPELSRPPAGQAHTKMSEVVHFLLKPDKAAEFRHALQRAHEAIGKTNWPVTYLWYELSNGGEGPHFVLVLPHNSWAEMAQPEMSFPAMLTKAFGPYETGVILEGFDQSSRSQWSEILVYRPDLSHVASQ
jgi:hypothetical protein